MAPETASPATVVLIPFCVSGHLSSMMEVGKRMLRSCCSDDDDDRTMSLTVLLAQLPESNRAPELDETIRREAEADSGYDIRFHCLPAEELPDFRGGEDFISRFMRQHASHEVAEDFEEIEGAVDLPGFPPVTAALLPTLVLKKDHNYSWLVYHGNRFMEAAGIIVNTVAELDMSHVVSM
ncbi:hypothetical protein E2562_034764 [Oryza meyeriana var. granulata]|uniref:Uncharacterized protein n=1 Tax=Oryza meyeriana var. granulata TaxID=110450 RepID=A0A6G1CKY3_9ORYZ|nr:hypothetical protein E2562_034764 [Oryza meyeriana var. granulata]